MNRFKLLISKTNFSSLTPQESIVSSQQATSSPLDGSFSKRQLKFTKSGPELLITKILMIHGPLQNKELWRVYQRMLKENGQTAYFESLTQMKRILKFMRQKEKIKSAGYNKKMREHLGWQIQTQKALKYVHPQAIEEIQNKISSKDLL